jgi:hypothetical protein
MKTIYLKHSLLLVFALFLSQFAWAQKPMASPRDSVSGKAGKATVSINYGSPSVKGRKIWGDLVPYNKVWRAGANEATTITTDQPLQIEGKTLPAGKYSFFVIPTEKTWTVIFNKTANQWGAYEYSEKQDALRVTVTPKKSGEMHERLAYKINDKGFILLWENLEVPVSAN